MKLMPASSAAWMMRMDSAWSVLPQAPNIIVPRQSGETWTPVRPSGRCSMCVLLLLGRHLAGDDDALDLVGAFVDLGDLGVAHHALDGVLVDVAVAAEDLDGVDGDLHGVVGGEQLGHRAVLRGLGVAGVGQGAGLVEQ